MKRCRRLCPVDPEAGCGTVRLVIRVAPAFRGRIDKKRLRRVVRGALLAHGAGTGMELSLLITDDATVRALNSRYRGQDRNTDVLSFALEADGASGIADGDAGFVMPPGEMAQLGEVIVSYPTAAQQAAERDQPVEEELELLVAHGVLHLLGYDHDRPAKEREMRSLEQKALSMARARSEKDQA